MRGGLSGQLAILVLGDELLGDGELDRVVVLGLARDDDVDLGDTRGDNIGGLGLGGLEEESGTVGLVELQKGNSAVGLELHLLGSHDLNRTNGAVWENKKKVIHEQRRSNNRRRKGHKERIRDTV